MTVESSPSRGKGEGMSRSSYGWRSCPVPTCKRNICVSGWARASHYRMHVRRGEMTEKKPFFDYFRNRWVSSEFKIKAMRVAGREIAAAIREQKEG